MRPDGALLVVIPMVQHLSGLREPTRDAGERRGACLPPALALEGVPGWRQQGEPCEYAAPCYSTAACSLYTGVRPRRAPRLPMARTHESASVASERLTSSNAPAWRQL
jgi:hypothetical protein